MKKILIVSATRKTNYTLAKKLEEILLTLDVETTVISLENYELPLYTDDIYKNKKDKYLDVVESLTKQFSEHKGLVICGPEYNGSIPPIITNAIAWISVSTDYWRDAFKDKVSLVASYSGGPGKKFISTMQLQLQHLGALVMDEYISVNDRSPLERKLVEKILKQFINLI